MEFHAFLNQSLINKGQAVAAYKSDAAYPTSENEIRKKKGSKPPIT